MKTRILTLLVVALGLVLGGCFTPDADDRQAMASERVQKQGVAEVGLPSITNFREMKMAKDIYERRDKAITTYTYVLNEVTGKFTFLGDSVGYGLPYAASFTSPEKADHYPQAEPNGLFSPSSAEGTWVELKDPLSGAVEPVYVEARVLVSPFKLPASIVAQ